jgi:hypothetical protein
MRSSPSDYADETFEHDDDEEDSEEDSRYNKKPQVSHNRLTSRNEDSISTVIPRTNVPSYAQSPSHRSHTPSRSSPSPAQPASQPSKAPAAVNAFVSTFSSASEKDMDDPYADLPTFECPECGRSFVEKALQKHISICGKQKARRIFDVRKQRLPEDAKLVAPKREDNKKQETEKQSKWRIERARLQEAMKAGKEISQAIKEGRDLSTLPPPKPSIHDDRVPCPYCNRKFASDTAERHIPHCQKSHSRMTARAPPPKRR